MGIGEYLSGQADGGRVISSVPAIVCPAFPAGVKDYFFFEKLSLKMMYTSVMISTIMEISS